MSSLTHLLDHKLLSSINGRSTHLSNLNDPNDHLAMFLHSIERSSSRGVMVVLDLFQLPEDVIRNAAHLYSTQMQRGRQTETVSRSIDCILQPFDLLDYTRALRYHKLDACIGVSIN